MLLLRGSSAGSRKAPAAVKTGPIRQSAYPPDGKCQANIALIWALSRFLLPGWLTQPFAGYRRHIAVLGGQGEKICRQ